MMTSRVGRGGMTARLFCTKVLVGMIIVSLSGLSAVSSGAGERGINPQLQRPLDIPTERLERPRSEQDRPVSVQQTNLRQTNVIALAKAAAKKELGKSYDDYELKAVVFDATEKIWSVTFDPKQPRHSSEACVIIFVHDDTKDTKLRHCS
jgi:hypothetical protein